MKIEGPSVYPASFSIALMIYNLLEHAVLDYGHLKHTRLVRRVKATEKGGIPWAQ